MNHRPPKEQREGFLTELTLNEERIQSWKRFPFNIEAVRDLAKVRFHPAVTFLIGENGSGKSTILEAMAVRMGHPETGGPNMLEFTQRPLDGGLHDAMRIVKSRNRRPSESFFMRAETVFDFTNYIEREIRESPYGMDFRRYGGTTLHNRSHGEAFLAIVQNRLTDESLFLMDEPEAALSPARQLTLLKEIDILVTRGCQFVIATHSPIVMAYPDSTIYELGAHGIQEIDYEDTEHYRLTRSFLEHPKTFLRHLLEGE